MDREELRSYCASKPGATAEYPFGPGARVYKVWGKMFALVNDDEPLRVNLKCDPVLARMLRDSYPAVQPGYHLNKQHWNTVTLDGTIDDDRIREMIDDSYGLVVKSLPKSARKQLASE